MRRAFAERIRKGEKPIDVLNEELERFRAGPFKEDAFSSRLRSERVAAILGIALGVLFLACFLTGLISHLLQHPLKVGFLSWPARPSWLYRVTQGVHVAAGIAAIPLTLAKLWSVYDRLWEFPPVKSVAHAVERALIAPLVAGSVFLLLTGLLDTTTWYPWEFSFPITHFWVAWITVGALVAHLGAKWFVTRRGISDETAVALKPGTGGGGGLDRRRFLGGAFAASGLLTLLTVGQTFRPLKGIAVLASRKPDVGPQGFPVNKSAISASVTKSARDPGYRLKVGGQVRTPLSLSLDELRAMPQHEADLPITCVEGWSAGARWRGVRVRDLLARAGADSPGHVHVQSLQEGGSYSKSTLNSPHLEDPDTLLALEVNGAPLHIDHGFPCRLIAPNRPGVQQTKWVKELTVEA